jgi:hypothetical protein
MREKRVIRTTLDSKNQDALDGRRPLDARGRPPMSGPLGGLFLVLFMAITGLATEIDLGTNLGYRQLKDPDLGKIYGDGFVYELFTRYFPLESYGIELSFEGGYKRDALVGLYQEKSTLTVGGIQLAGVFRYPVGKLAPYFKFGVGYFSYKQNIESEFVRFKVDHHKLTTVVGLGMTFDIFRGLFLSAELKYVPLKVQPFDIAVDLGGMRYLAGLGFRRPL